MPSRIQELPLVRAVIVGVTGRMGRALLRAAPAFARLLVTGAIASPSSLALGRDAGEVAGVRATNLTVTSDLPGALAQADVVLDFSSAAATRANLAACRAARKALLLGTTGYDGQLQAELDEAARDIPLLVAANTSIGVALLTELVRSAARLLPATFDTDVLKMHHRTKEDAPSGTALALARAAAEVRGATLGLSGMPGVPGTAGTTGAEPRGASGPRPEATISLTSVRAGDLVGEHTVLFTGIGEQLSLAHRASDRSIFARGALLAALWLTSQPPGRYAMGNFLGSKTTT
jgi:4-hydroxy-tetrahydrodipicolinate reductase